METHWNRSRVLETGVLKGLYRHPSMQIILTLSPEVCKCYLHWAATFLYGHRRAWGSSMEAFRGKIVGRKQKTTFLEVVHQPTPQN